MPWQNRCGLVLLSAAIVASCSDATSADPRSLDGRFELSEWNYVYGSESLPITGESYLLIDFRGHDQVDGEGHLFLEIPSVFGNGTDTVPILGRVEFNNDGQREVVPLELRGWYSVHLGTGGPDTLRFRLQRGHGADTWLEHLDWILADDRRSYLYEEEDPLVRLRIVVNRRR
jgi:hypothetical protein